MSEVSRIERSGREQETGWIVHDFLERYPTIEALRRDIASFYKRENLVSPDTAGAAGASWINVLDELAGLCSFLGSVRRAGESASPADSSPSATNAAPLLRLAVKDGQLRMHPGSTEAVLRREGDSWSIAYHGEGFRLRNAKGLDYIAHLLRHPNHDFHVLDLVAAMDDRPRDCDSGAVLDHRAKREYRGRLAELESELETVERCNDIGRIAPIRCEIEFLTSELSRSVGFGGRDRCFASATEKARQNVSRAIKAAIGRIAEQSSALGRHLEVTVRSGVFCSYTPDPLAPVRWQL
jgi:hypothetical protein